MDDTAISLDGIETDFVRVLASAVEAVHERCQREHLPQQGECALRAVARHHLSRTDTTRGVGLDSSNYGVD